MKIKNDINKIKINNRNSVLVNNVNLSSKNEARYKRVFKKEEYLTAKRNKNLKNIYLNNNITYSYTPKCFKNLDKGFKKRNLPLNLFFLKGNNSLKRNDTDIKLNDIKSYEISLVALPIEDDQEKLKEKKLSNLYHSLITLTQNDQLLTNTNFEEKLESSIEFIINYLSIPDLFNLALINKEFYKMILRNLLEKVEIKIEKIKNKINDIIKQNKGFINIRDKDFKNFDKNIFNERALNLLNNISKKKLFREKSYLMNNKDIVFILELYFIFLGKKYDIIQFNTKDSNTISKKWNYFCKYFNNIDNKYLKNDIEKVIMKGKINDEIINSLYEWAFKFLDKIKPNHYQKINKDIAIFAFIIKDLLDYFGINYENKVESQKLYILNNIRLNINEKVAQKLNQMIIKFE